MALSVVVTACATVLIRTGGGSRSIPLASVRALGDWLRTTTPPDIAVGLVRLVALAACAYMALGLAVTVLAGLAPHRRLVTATARLTPAALRRTILRGAVPGLATGMALLGLAPVAANPAGAQPAALRFPADDPEAHTATMTKLPPASPDTADPSTSATMTHLDDTLGLPDGPADPSPPPISPSPPGDDGARPATPPAGPDDTPTDATTTAPTTARDEPRPDATTTTTTAIPTADPPRPDIATTTSTTAPTADPPRPDTATTTSTTTPTADPDEPRSDTATTTTATPGTDPPEAPPGAREPRTPTTSSTDAAQPSPSPSPTPVPAPAPAPGGRPAPGPRDDEWIVAPGESFWSIAEETLRDAGGGAQPSDDEISRYWHHLIDVNRDRLAAPENPDLLHVGQVLALPPP